MKKRSKGEWGYINGQRLYVLMITIVLYACAAGLYFIGYLTLHTNRSLWTILAILSVLPASKSMVNLIMFLRFRSLPADVHDEYEKAKGQLPVIYELPFTTYEKTYFVDAIACAGSTAAGCYLGKASGKMSHDCDIKNLSDHLTTVLKNDGHKDFTIKIYDDKDDFIKRLAEMNVKLNDKRSDADEMILSSLKAVSL